MKWKRMICRVITVVGLCLAVIIMLEIIWVSKLSETRKTEIQPVSTNSMTIDYIDGPSDESTISNRTNHLSGTKKLTHPKLCIRQWRVNHMTVEEVLRCIDRYMVSSILNTS